MAEHQDAVSATAEVQPAAGAHGSGGGIMDPSPTMVGLTWITFVIMAYVLYKVAWKPILKALDQRERTIRKALDDAERARQEMDAAETRSRQLLQEAEAQARQIVTEARAAAQEAARLIQERADKASAEQVEQARREIRTATDQARVELRHETAELALMLAGKVVAENMDTDRNRALVQGLMKEL